MPDVPYGECHCGCGEKTNLAPWDYPERGWIKGQPKRYVKGHNGRLMSAAYIEDPDTGCWIWQRSGTPQGYGRYKKNGKMLCATWLFYEAAKGPVPEGLELDHLCRNPPCVNPAHLEAVTPAENIRRRPTTKLTMEIAEEIRATEGTHVAVAEQFGVSPTHVANIRAGRLWKPDPARTALEVPEHPGGEE